MKDKIVTAFTLFILCWLMPSGHLCAQENLSAQEESTMEPPYGIWAWHVDGEKHLLNVSLQNKSGVWTGKVDGKSVPVSEQDGEITLQGEGGQYFSAHLLDDGHLEGSWFQPESNIGFYGAMATIVNFAPSAPQQWQGVVNLQPRPFSLFLDIHKDENGKARAVVRNPERNDIFGATYFDINFLKAEGKIEQWQLHRSRGSREISVPFSYAKDAGITLEHSEVPHPVVLHPATDAELEKYFSREQKKAEFHYQPAKQLNDGWEVLDAVKAGFDRTILDNLVTKLSTFDPRDARPQLLHSVLVSHQGKLVLEEYFYGHTAEDVHDVRSLAKSFGSMMVGAARQQGMDISPSYTPLPAVFKSHGLAVPDYADKITLEHFLTYTTGLDTSENDASPGSESNLWEQEKEDFWLYTAKLPVLHPPGSRYAYSSASANMVGAAIEQVTGMEVRKFFHQSFAKPLQFSPYHWDLTPHGQSYLAGGVYMRPRDILKLGAVYAAEGRWHGQQIVPADWVALSTSAKIPINLQTTGLDEEAYSQEYVGGSQAYNWRVDTIEVGDKSYDSYEATGNGGQILVVVPALDLAAAMTGGDYRMGIVWSKWRQQILGDYVIPALLVKK